MKEANGSGRGLFWTLGAIAAALVAAVVALVVFGLKPKPIRQINPTEFQSVSHVGVAAFHRLRPDWSKYDLVILVGSRYVRGSDEIWSALALKAAAFEGKRKLRLFEQVSAPKLRLPQSIEKREFTNWDDGTAEQVKESLADGARVMVHLSGPLNSDVLENLLLTSFPQSMRERAMILVQEPFAIDPGQLDQLEPKCERPDETAYFAGCSGRTFSQKYFRKRFQGDRFIGAMERLGSHLWAIFVFEPKSTQ